MSWAGGEQAAAEELFERATRQDPRWAGLWGAKACCFPVGCLAGSLVCASGGRSRRKEQGPSTSQVLCLAYHSRHFAQLPALHNALPPAAPCSPGLRWGSMEFIRANTRWPPALYEAMERFLAIKPSGT